MQVLGQIETRCALTRQYNGMTSGVKCTDFSGRSGQAEVSFNLSTGIPSKHCLGQRADRMVSNDVAQGKLKHI